MATLGIEEEYLLLDPKSLFPAWVSAEVSGFIHGTGQVADEDVQRELLSCQLETATPVCNTLEEAGEALLHFRKELSAAAMKAGARASSSSTAPRAEAGPAELTDKQRYYDLKEDAQEVATDQYVNGLHVHVGIPDRDTGVRALNRIRAWLPAIVALSVNSPLWQDHDTGFASWRTIHFRRWPLQGCPPEFADADDYDRRVQRMLGIGAIIDTGLVTWLARLSENYPTIEVRAADSQLEVKDTLLLAGIIRGLIVTAINDVQTGQPYESADPELLEGAVWQSARYGLSGNLVLVSEGVLKPAREVIGTLLEYISPALDEAGDTETVKAGVERLFDSGTGDVRQRAAMDHGGLPALMDLYTTSLIAE